MSSPSENPDALGYHEVKAKIGDAARRSGRDPSEITIVGVCKAQPVERVRSVMGAGLRSLGANYLQEWATQSVALQDLDPQWHFVGRIQRKKLVKIVGCVSLIHSVDRWEVLEEIQKRAQQKGVVQDVLIQVNIAAEDSKAGVSAAELTQVVRDASAMSGVRVSGLMFMPPATDDVEETRPWFRQGADLLKRVRSDLGDSAQTLTQLSMGMSGDYVQAVEEGATIIRVGTALFGARSYA